MGVQLPAYPHGQAVQGVQDQAGLQLQRSAATRQTLERLMQHSRSGTCLSPHGSLYLGSGARV